MMFERFDQEARRVVESAQLHARRLNHELVGTEHLLLGLASEPRGPAGRLLFESGITPRTLRHQIATEVGACESVEGNGDAEALRAIGIDLEEVRRRTEEAFGPMALSDAGPRQKGRSFGEIPLSPRSRRALTQGEHEARALGADDVRPEHLLLALLRDREALAAELMRRRGVHPDYLRERVMAALGEAP